jgi:ankyrin repeat protein
MKIKLTFLLLFIAYCSQAQQLSNPMKNALKADDPKSLLLAVKEQGHKIDDCFEIESVQYSLLALAIKMEKPVIFKALLDQKVRLNQICSDKSPLMFAAKYGKLAMVKALVEAGAAVKLTSAENKSALDYAIKYQQKEVENYLGSLKIK